jgi:hypothetical protein
MLARASNQLRFLPLQMAKAAAHQSFPKSVARMQRAAASSLLGIFELSVRRVSRSLIAPALTYETSVRNSRA